MSDLFTYEYSVAQKIEGKWVFKKIGMIFLYIAFVIFWFVFGFVTKLFPVMALIPLTLWILVFITWRYVKVEYEYSIISGLFTLSNVYGNRSRKKVVEFKIKDCCLIAPLKDSEEKIASYAPEKVYSGRSSVSSRDTYVALVDIDGKKTAVYFEATEKALKICQFYNASATTVTKTTY
ncbi:MAG: hypothetical protein IKT56_06190 [Clostridia bacterium]|nr:hypothetical protein [Clostridia bacterium]